MDTGEDLQGSNSQSCSTCPWFSPLDVGCQIIISYDIILVFVFSPSYTRKYWVTTSFHHKSGRLGPENHSIPRGGSRN